MKKLKFPERIGNTWIVDYFEDGEWKEKAFNNRVDAELWIKEA